MFAFCWRSNLKGQESSVLPDAAWTLSSCFFSQGAWFIPFNMAQLELKLNVPSRKAFVTRGFDLRHLQSAFSPAQSKASGHVGGGNKGPRRTPRNEGPDLFTDQTNHPKKLRLSTDWV